MKKILVPTDFSASATNAFIHAIELANRVKAELILLHTFELPIYDSQFFPDNYALLYESVELANFEAFKEVIPKLRSIAKERNLEHIVIKHRLMDGDLLYNLKAVVTQDHIDCVVMGTTGANDWTKFFVGSNTNSVISEVSVPVFCVPAKTKHKRIKYYGFTTRFLQKDKVQLYKLIELAKKTNSKIRCLYVKTSFSNVTETVIKEWEREFERENVEFQVLLSDEIKESILDFIRYKEIDVITTITHKRTFFESIFDSSFTKKITSEVDIPILVLHEN